jgi:hypothetical protein
MKNVKKVMCSGLMFTGKEDMEMLHRYAKEGWVFKEFKGLSYYMYKEEPKDVIFTYDLISLREDEKVEYFEMFKKQGWHHIPTSNLHEGTYFFWADNGTKPVHTDKEIEASRYKPFFKFGIFCLFIGVLGWIGSTFFLFGWMELVVSALFGATTGVALMMIIGALFQLRKKRLRLYIRFKTAVMVFLISFFAYIINKYGVLFAPNIIVSVIMGSLMGFFGVISITQYKQYRDNKEL